MTYASFIAAAVLTFVLQTNSAFGQSTFDTVLRDLRGGYFERTYKGKPFSATGEIELYERRAGWIIRGRPTPAYVQIFNFEAGATKAWCVLSEWRFKKMQKDYPVGTKVRMTGKMLEWYLADSTLLLADNCILGPEAGNDGPFDMKVVEDMRAYFDRTYRGKTFSDVGVISNYSDAGSTGLRSMSVEKASDARDSVWCRIDEDQYNRLRTAFPVGRKVRVTGAMAEWSVAFFLSNTPTLRLENNCAIGSQ